jgi:hypothetical protein
VAASLSFRLFRLFFSFLFEYPHLEEDFSHTKDVTIGPRKQKTSKVRAAPRPRDRSMKNGAQAMMMCPGTSGKEHDQEVKIRGALPGMLFPSER